MDGYEFAGLGYTAPVLESVGRGAARCVSLLPERCGCEGILQSVALVDETSLPLADASLDRMIVMHAIEHAENPAASLRELWRVLVPGGKVLLVVPNRRGGWARGELTPFGHGRPYSKSQLERLLADTLFEPRQWSGSLILPPSPRVANLLPAFEPAGRKWWSRFAGVLVVEAEKQLYGGTLAPGKARVSAKPSAIPVGPSLRSEREAEKDPVRRKSSHKAAR